MNLPTQLRPRIDGPSDKYDVRPWTVVGINPDDLRAAGWVPAGEVREAIKAAKKNREGCWCSDTRKPCEYHGGMDYAADIIEQALDPEALSEEP